MRKPLIAFFLSSSLAGASAQADNLLDVYRQAADNDPQWRAAAAEYAAIREARPQARALLLPQASLEADYFRNRQEISKSLASDGTAYYTTKGYGLNLRQMLYHHDYYVQLQQADARIAEAEANYHAAEQALMLRVADRYFAVLSASDTLEFANTELKAIARQLEQAEQRFEVGLVAITDVHEAKARHDQAKAEQIAADNGLAIAREALRELTAAYPAALDRLAEDLPLPAPAPNDVETWVQTALTGNLPLLAADAATEAAAQEVQRQCAGHLPTLDLVASHGLTDLGGGNFGSRQSEDSSIGVQLQVPLYSGGAVVSRTREATHRHQQAKDLREQARRAAERQSREAFLGVQASISRVEALRQAVVSSRTALEAAEAGNEVGTRTIVDVLDAQGNLYRAQRDYARARYDYLLNTLRLKQATGALAVSDIEQINTHLTAIATP